MKQNPDKRYQHQLYNIPTQLKKFRYYHYYSKSAEPSYKVLIKKEIIKPKDFIVAWLYYKKQKDKQDKKQWIFLKFDSIQEFLKKCYNGISYHLKRFHVVFTTPIRCLYLDVDCYHNDNQKWSTLFKEIHMAIFDYITKTFRNFNQEHVYIWYNDRLISKNNNKLSIHIIYPTIWFNNPATMQSYVEKLKDVIDLQINFDSGIDLEIYKNPNFQLWKLPGNHNGKHYKSDLILYGDKTLTLKEQISINKCYGINEKRYNIKLIKNMKPTTFKNLIDIYNLRISESIYYTINKKLPNVTWIPFHKNCKFQNKKHLQFAITGYKCPYKGRIHTRNRAKVDIYLQYKYLSIRCLDKEDCGIHHFCIKLTNKLHYPWLHYLDISNRINNDINQHVDAFLYKQLEVDKSITIKNIHDNKELILKQTIKYWTDNNYISFKFSNDITCDQGHNNIKYELRSSAHKHWTVTEPDFLYCAICNKKLNK